MDPEKTPPANSRRDFVKKSAAASVWLATLPVWEEPLIRSTLRSRTYHGVCYHDCPDACAWKVTTVDGKVTRFQASEDHPFTNGSLCDKMKDFPAITTFHPERVLYPMKRVGPKGSGEFERTTWEEAITAISNKLKEAISRSGAESIMPFSFAGTEGLVQQGLVSKAFFAQLGASQLERSICGNAAAEGVLRVTGSTTGVLTEDIVHSRYIVIWGSNTITTNQHLWPFIEQARQKGAKLVVIDPVRSHTAVEADWHLQPRPGTDVVLALAMMEVIISDQLHDVEYLSAHTEGFEALKSYVTRFSPEQASGITGVPAEDIRQLAREYASEKASLIRILIGMEHNRNGGNSFRAIAMLPALTGAWTTRGGGFMHMTYELSGKALNGSWATEAIEKSQKDTRTFNMIELGQVLNDDTLSPPLQAMIVYNSNPAVIVPDQNAVIRGLEREDLFTVVIDHFITDTGLYADYFLPATTQLEHWDLQASWGQEYIALNEPAIAPQGESLPNSEIFRRLAKAMGLGHSCFEDSDLDIVKAALNSDAPYLKGISFKSLRKNGWAKFNLPDPWMPFANGGFGTPSGKCMLYDPDAQDPFPEYRESGMEKGLQTQYPLQLLTLKSTRNFLNSSHANAEDLRESEGEPRLDINKTDAFSRNIRTGDMVRIYNQRGELHLKARVSEMVKPGIATLPQGHWAMFAGNSRSANALTPDTLTDMGGGAAFHENFVEVSRIA